MGPMFDTNLKTENVLSLKEVHMHSQSYLKVKPESFYKVTFLLLHIASASPAQVADVQCHDSPKIILRVIPGAKDPDTREVTEVDKGRGQHS